MCNQDRSAIKRISVYTRIYNARRVLRSLLLFLGHSNDRASARGEFAELDLTDNAFRSVIHIQCAALIWLFV